jgi:hypothetical protein
MTGDSKRQLPPIPHPDHLRKQAKVRLAAMRVTALTTRLAEAQSLIAREYGFASWAALQAEVARRMQSPMGQWRMVRRAHLAPHDPTGAPADDGQDAELAFTAAGGAAQIGGVLAILVGMGLVIWTLYRGGLLSAFHPV